MSVFPVLFVCLCALLVNGCGGPQLKPLDSDATILAFGDSLTAGKGVAIEQSYPTVLSQLTGLDVINAGVSGEISKDGLARLPEVLDQYPVDLMILIEGGNDILRNLDLSQTQENLDQMIQLAKHRGIDVVLFGVPKKSLFSDSADFYHVLANKHGLIFDDELIADMLRSSQFKSDSVHFNQKGYYKLAARAHELLQDNGAL
ncbi:arylesterase [Thalassotalea litorea]|uniref:Arylesterase n=2 Tax=Thalassotalea litorea TaxID=2020715 RepID=A0A5R9IQR3_9GAMM|nr:arylesterase [Thalassotalea litorea]